MQRSGIETGTVLQTDGVTAKVITNKSKACNECGKAQAGICGKQGAGMVMNVRNAIGAAQGDIVTIDLDRSTHIKAYFIVFIIPIVALFVFSYIGSLLGTPGLEVILGISGLAVSLLLSAHIIRKLNKSAGMKISSILGKDESFEAMTQEEMDYLRAYKVKGFS